MRSVAAVSMQQPDEFYDLFQMLLLSADVGTYQRQWNSWFLVLL